MQSRCCSKGFFPPIGPRCGSHKTRKMQWFSTQKSRGVTHSAQWTRNPEHNSVRFGRRSPIGQSSSPVSTGPAHFVKKKNHRLSISAGLSESLVALCLFFCHTKEWKGVFPQPVRQPSPVPSSEASLPLCSSAQHICVFSSFLLQVKGCHLGRGGEKHM